jgi:adenosylcobinamide amidohydrolase
MQLDLISEQVIFVMRKLVLRIEIIVYAIATIGFNNARSAGDSADVDLDQLVNKPGKINLIVSCNALSYVSVLIDSINIATMAKTFAIIEAGAKSKGSKQLAMSTETDCILIAESGKFQDIYC